MSKGVVETAQEIVNQSPTVENARRLNRLIREAKGEEKDFIYDLVESFLMQVEEPNQRDALLKEID